MPTTEDTLIRLESKVDKIADAIVHLARVDERLANVMIDVSQITVRLEDVSERGFATRNLLDKWINRGLGAWAIVGVGVGAFKFFVH